MCTADVIALMCGDYDFYACAYTYTCAVENCGNPNNNVSVKNLCYVGICMRN